MHLAEAYIAAGQSEQAEILVEEAIGSYRGFGKETKVGRLLAVLARIAMSRAQYERAAVLLGSSTALCETDGMFLHGGGLDKTSEMVCDLRVTLAESFDRNWERGLGMDEREAASYALGSGPTIPTYRRRPR
jgi:hypothetical protein